MTDDGDFRRQVRRFYQEHGRYNLPWRTSEADGSFDPYKILVSEIMLQQTQVGRVLPKYNEFVERFPSIGSLARASLGDVLRAWSGLGYNRRAKFLHQAAQLLVERSGGRLPDNLADLVALPGIGVNTAGAILAYAFDKPTTFVETNIRTVFIHHFFRQQSAVSDKAIAEIVARTLPTTDVRGWYWALMDYGAHLKQSIGNLSRVSSSYAKQSKFAGSQRQIRGQVIRLLGERPRSQTELRTVIADERLARVLEELQRECLINSSGQLFSL